MNYRGYWLAERGDGVHIFHGDEKVKVASGFNTAKIEIDSWLEDVK